MTARKSPVIKTIPDPAITLVTTAIVCATLGCSRDTVLRLCRQGKLERIKLNGQTRITLRSVNALVDEALEEAKKQR